MEQKKTELVGFLQQNMNHFLQPMMVAVLKAKPANPAQFCIKWLQKYQANKKKQQDLSDHQEQDNVDELIKKKKQLLSKNKKKSRLGISEEVFGAFNKRASFQPHTIEKSQQAKILILSLIRNSILFQNISTSDQKIIINAMGQQQCQQGQTIITEGQDGDNLFIVESGQYDCYKFINGQQKYLKTYTFGESFGQLALMYNAPRAATIRCKKGGNLFILDRQTFSNVVKDANIKKRSLFRSILEKIDIFSQLDATQRDQFCDVLKEQRAHPGEYVIKQGEKGDKFYIIIEGTLVAEKQLTPKQDPQIVYHYKEGDYFGQLSLINDINRQASIKALTTVKLVSVARESFIRILGSLKDILKRNADRYSKYSTELV